VPAPDCGELIRLGKPAFVIVPTIMADVKFSS
jgi:hypothetical protein